MEGKTQEDKEKETKGESCFKRSRGLRNGVSNSERDLPELIRPPLFPVAALLNEAWLRHAREEAGDELDRTPFDFSL